MTAPVGAMLDNMPVWCSMLGLSLAAAVHSALVLFPGTYIQMTSFLVFAYYRAALFGASATIMSFTFGQENFGKLWGLLYLSAGLFNLLIFPIAGLAKEWGSYRLINLGFEGLSIVMLAYPLWLWACESALAASPGTLREKLERWHRILNENTIEEVRLEMHREIARM